MEKSKGTQSEKRWNIHRVLALTHLFCVNTQIIIILRENVGCKRHETEPQKQYQKTQTTNMM